MIQVLSISFQLAGALILLLWCFKAVKKERIKERFFVKGTHIERNENGIGHIDKKYLQNLSKEALLNIFAFVNLIIGYGVTFWESDNYCRCCAILFTIILTASILIIEYILSWIISLIRFSKDMELTSDEIEKMDVITNMIPSEIDQIFDDNKSN